MSTASVVVLSAVLLPRPDIGLGLGLDVEVDEAHLRVSGEASQLPTGICNHSSVIQLQQASATARHTLLEEVVEVPTELFEAVGLSVLHDVPVQDLGGDVGHVDDLGEPAGAEEEDNERETYREPEL